MCKAFRRRVGISPDVRCRLQAVLPENTCARSLFVLFHVSLTQTALNRARGGNAGAPARWCARDRRQAWRMRRPLFGCMGSFSLFRFPEPRLPTLRVQGVVLQVLAMSRHAPPPLFPGPRAAGPGQAASGAGNGTASPVQGRGSQIGRRAGRRRRCRPFGCMGLFCRFWNCGRAGGKKNWLPGLVPGAPVQQCRHG